MPLNFSSPEYLSHHRTGKNRVSPVSRASPAHMNSPLISFRYLCYILTLSLQMPQILPIREYFWAFPGTELLKPCTINFPVAGQLLFGFSFTLAVLLFFISTSNIFNVWSTIL